MVLVKKCRPKDWAIIELHTKCIPRPITDKQKQNRKAVF